MPSRPNTPKELQTALDLVTQSRSINQAAESVGMRPSTLNSRFKLIAYSREKSWTNGLCFYLWVISWLRSNGVTAKIVFTVDNGEEFGGKSGMKIRDLRKLISGFGCLLIQYHKVHPEVNAHLERSHRTDDDEFYRLRALRLHSEQHFLVYLLTLLKRCFSGNTRS